MNARFERYLPPDAGFARPRLFAPPRCYGGSSATQEANPSETTTAATGTGSSTTNGNSSPSAAGAASQVVAGGNVTLDTSPAIAEASLNAVQTLVGQALASTSGQNATDTTALQSQTNSIASLLNQVMQQEASNNLTTAGNGTTISSTTLWIIAAAAGLLLLALFGRKNT
jgi:hypothetical protein